MEGYNENFLGINKLVRIPNFDYHIGNVARNTVSGGYVLDYDKYSIVQSKSRRVPLISASNIYRVKFEPSYRSGSFRIDSRISNVEQLTSQDYKRLNSLKPATIEKGHMTKREDVQWDPNGDETSAQNAAKSTFYYPNAVPQHDSLNNGPWKHLENAVIIKGRVPKPTKVSVFTGPVLDELDPEFKVKLDDGSVFKIPILFYKVIYYVKEDQNLYYAGFLMGQINPLRRDNLIDEIEFRDFDIEEKKSSLKPFLEFKEDENYQVPISLIEELTKLRFENAIDMHAHIKPTELKLQDVQIRDFESVINDSHFPFEISGLLV